ncbi:MAG: InlB B-repeat-containing protein [Clostridia bacterium]|nr:InlB B-repeat-containing protein [Clostridia bacterium]
MINYATEKKRKNPFWQILAVTCACVLVVCLSVFIPIITNLTDNNSVETVEPVVYTVDFWVNGGRIEGEYESEFVGVGDEISLPTPRKEDDIFVGWYLNSDYSGDSVSSVTCDGKSVSVYAKWQSGECGIRYELGGGTCDGNPTVTNGSDVTTLYARYEPKTYTVTLFANGGIVDEKEVETCYLTYTYGTVLPLPVALKDEYTFECWVDDDGREFSEMTVYAYGDLVLTARYYRTDGTKIIYEKEGGEPTANLPEKIIHGTRQPLCSLTKEGFIFLGWQKPNGAIVGQYYVAKENNLTLTALYEGNNDFLGSDKTSPITLNVGDSVEIDLVLAQNVHFFIPDQGMAYQVKVIPLNDYTNVDGSCSGCFSYPVATALSLIDFVTQVTNWYTDFIPTLFCIEEGDQNFAIRRMGNSCGIAYSLRYKVSVIPYTP